MQRLLGWVTAAFPSGRTTSGHYRWMQQQQLWWRGRNEWWWWYLQLALVALGVLCTAAVAWRWWLLRRRRAQMKGRVVLVTGGANGLGRELVRRLHALGAVLIVWDIDSVALYDLEKELKDTRVHTYLVDLANRRAVYGVAKQVLKDVANVDVLINNAGVVSGKPLLELSDDDIQRTMAVNTMALFWTTKAFLPAMKQRNAGHLVNIASVLGIFGGARLTDYSASKFAAFGFSECVRMELKSERVSVDTTLVCPYHLDTGMFAGVRIPWYSSLLFPVLKSGRVAERIVEAILLREETVMIGYSFWLIFLLRFLYPVWLLDRIGCLMGAFNAMRSFVGRAKND